MDITLNNRQWIEPKALALSLWCATPDEFAAFWMAFYDLSVNANIYNDRVTMDGAKHMDRLAQAMAQPLGSNRLKVLRELVRLADFHAERNHREPTND